MRINHALPVRPKAGPGVLDKPMPKPHDFFIASNGDDATARADDCDAPFRTISAVLAYCHEHEITRANLLEWRVSSWHRVGGDA